ncbi:MAG: SGNH/GDSL hydrolase family protein [Myxococcota bacterium]|nr:SGNH/GDSL hydrolase family protein [Myxococcota bacterium]
MTDPVESNSRPSDPPSEAPPRGVRYWFSRLLVATLAPLVFVVVLELVVTGIWGPLYYPLPGLDEAAYYLHFTLPERFNPLFEVRDEEDGAFCHTVPELYEGSGYFVKKQRFPAQRDESALRIAFMGGSSVQGWPWREDGVVFAERVGERLSQHFEGRRFDIINAGVGSYSSFQLVDVAWQLDSYSPDVVVIYAGHNDQGYYFFNRTFLEETAEDTMGGNSIERFLNRFNFYQGGRLLRDRMLAGTEGDEPPTQRPGSAGDADPDRPEAIVPETAFIPQDERIAEIGEHRYADWVRIQQQYLPQIFEANLEAVIDRLQASGATVVLALPTSNLRDYPPAFSLFFEPVGDAASKRFVKLLDEAAAILNNEGLHPRRLRAIEGNGEFIRASEPWGPLPIEGAPERGSELALARCGEVLDLLAQARKISESYARLHFLEGTCLVHSDPVAARAAFERARDLSPAMAPKQRAGSKLVDVMKRVAERHGLPLVDTPAAFTAESELGITDGVLFVDNLHFSVRGHEVAAEAITEVLATLPVVRDGAPAGRRPDPSPGELHELLRERARNPQWGLDIHVPGANEPYKDETGTTELPGHVVEEQRRGTAEPDR